MIKLTKRNIRVIIMYSALAVGFFALGKIFNSAYYWAIAIAGGMIVFDLALTYVNQRLDRKIARLKKQLEDKS